MSSDLFSDARKAINSLEVAYSSALSNDIANGSLKITRGAATALVEWPYRTYSHASKTDAEYVLHLSVDARADYESGEPTGLSRQDLLARIKDFMVANDTDWSDAVAEVVDNEYGLRKEEAK